MHFEKFQNSMDRMNPDWTDKNMKNFETSSVTNSTNFYIAKFRLLNNLQLIFKYLFFYFPCVPNVFQNNNFFPETVASSVIWLGGRLSGMKLQTKAAI